MEFGGVSAFVGLRVEGRGSFASCLSEATLKLAQGIRGERS
jgi:hypothetical protein